MVDFFGLQIYDFEELSVSFKENRPVIINLINAWSFYCFYHNKLFHDAVEDSFNLPDGLSIVLGNRLLNKIYLKRFAGYDLLLYLLNNGNTYNIKKVMFVGSSKKVQHEIKSRLKKDFPLLESSLIPLAFKKSFTKEDVYSLNKKINQFMPDVVFVGLSAPKQEVFTYQYLREHKQVRVICNVGAAFEFFAYTELRAPKWMQKAGLEGLFRTFFHPVRHLKKDLKSYPFLIKKLFQHQFK